MKIVKVKSIKKIENSSKRYDIQTKMTNNFFANGILVHNCTILYYDQINEKWAVQTLGQIEAEEKIPGWGSTGLNITWARLFWDTFEKYTDVKICNKLDKNYSYIFEMCTPYNKVVVKYETSKLVFIGMRSKVTLMEAETKTSLLYDLFDKPKEYKFENLKEIKRVCSEVLTDQEEGFVIALERKIIPYLDKDVDARSAFMWAIMRIGTNLTSGWFRDFAIDNYINIIKHDHDYVGKFKEALANGKIRKILNESK